MATQLTTARRWFAIAIMCLVFFSGPLPVHAAPAVAGQTTAADGYQFVCNDDGAGLSAVDVLRASGDHNTFLSLFSRYDPEGFGILSDPELSDKTIWAPTDAAFAEVSDSLRSLSDDDITAILGYHITPPRRTPEGPYPIITPEFLIDGGEVVHQTRTGIVTGSDQRVRTTVTDGVLTVEDSIILPTSWCTQTGSVFSISAVIADAAATSGLERVLYLVFFRYPLLPLVGLGAAVAGFVVYLRRKRRARRGGRR